MRGSQQPLIRRVVHGPDYRRRPLSPPNLPISPAIENLLSRPTWSVRSLLPPSKAGHNTGSSLTIKTKAEPSSLNTTIDSTPSQADDQEEITVSKLHHLLKLSALPLPKTPKEEATMLNTLRDQIHFVRAIQSVDTRGVEPLVTIRDETREAAEEETITLETMAPYLALEEKVGRNGTVRRRDVVRTSEEDRRERRRWEVDVNKLGLGSAWRRRGKMFFVRRRKVDRRDTSSAAAVQDQQQQLDGKSGKVKEEVKKEGEADGSDDPT